jgi:hypothetical protein
MPASNVFSNMLVGSQLEEAAIKQMVTWIPTYLRELESRLGIEINSVPRPEHFSNRNSFDYQPGEKYPKVVAITPGLSGAPVADGAGMYRATWRLGVGVVLASTDEVQANLWVKVYGAAIRQIFLDKPSLGGLAAATRWEDEEYPDLPIANQNQLFKAAAVYFTVDCNNVATKWSGPDNPDEDPYNYGEVQSVFIDLVKVATDAEV